MARSRRERSLSLPWERTAGLRSLLTGSRWRFAIGVTALVAASYGTFRAATYHQEIHETRAAIDEVHRAVADFRVDVGRCPRSMAELVHPPRGKARYLRDVPHDAWGTPLYVRCPSRADSSQAEVVSAGPNHTFFEDDNVL